MGKLILVVGGKRSGKSDFAQGLAETFGDSILYIATLVPEDDEEVKKNELLISAPTPVTYIFSIGSCELFAL